MKNGRLLYYFLSAIGLSLTFTSLMVEGGLPFAVFFGLTTAVYIFLYLKAK